MRILTGLLLLAVTAVSQETSSVYVEMRDGVRLAIDVHLPAARDAAERHPTLFELTRYGRSTARRTLGRLDRYLLDGGYALVKVDARGSGASFGTRMVEYGPEEVRDGYDLVAWTVKQAWCDGNVGAYGTSYSGTTAELLTAVNHPAVKAVIPGWSDFDLYQSPVRPYGMMASAFIRGWSEMVAAMDRNDTSVTGASIRRVDEDKDGKMLAAALRDHARNPNVFVAVKSAEFRDDKLGGVYTYDHCHPLHWKAQIEKSGVPMFVPVSWMDAGTADGALLRFVHFSNPQRMLILASSHGGGSHASPYAVGRRPVAPRPSVREQFEMRRAFFDHHLKGSKNGVAEWPAVRFFNLGEEKFHDSDVWPPKGTRTTTFHLTKGNGLSATADEAEGTDDYEVDPSTSTGRRNRWMTQFGLPVLELDDRGAMDGRMLTYTSAPLDGDLQIAGTPVLSLRLASDHTDGVVLAYLEDVAPDGRSRYVTEGGLRLIHRKTSKNPYLDQATPYHSFKRGDARPMTPGKIEPVAFQLWPIAALIRKGHRIRLAISGADADTFDRIPATGRPTLTIRRGGKDPSVLHLPVVPGGLR